MTEARQLEPTVVEARDALATAGTLQLALGALASSLSDRYPISRISVRTYDPRADELEFVGVWSAGPTYLGSGIRVPARSTSFAEVELHGSSMLGRPDGRGGPLLDQIVGDEGNRAWVVVPLVRDRLLMGLLSVSTWEPDGFTSDDLPFFDALARAIGERLLELAGA